MCAAIKAGDYFYQRKDETRGMPPIFQPMLKYAGVRTVVQPGHYPSHGYAYVNNKGEVLFNPNRKLEPQEWVFVLAHCLLHLAFGHFQEKEHQTLWNVACDAFVNRFLVEAKIGRPPQDIQPVPAFSVSSEELLYANLVRQGMDAKFRYLGVAGEAQDMIFSPVKPNPFYTAPKWETLLADGMSDALKDVVVNIGTGQTGDTNTKPLTDAEQAKNWFISNYPLLGALAASFRIVEDNTTCGNLNVSVAAVSEDMQEIYFNPAKTHTQAEYRFIMAHELLHVGLRHQDRCKGRDPYLWNVACDFVINGWLVEMEVGSLPTVGVLYDPELKGMSVEEVYSRVTGDIRRYRKLATLRGVGRGDMLDRHGSTGPITDVDTFCREAMMQGLVHHEEQQRGLLPSGLIEEIHALAQPPIPWDVELARWFDGFFAPLEKRRSYARPSRRQSSTPDIARPSHVPKDDQEDARTFGVVLDTSGSMDRRLLAKALGAIASYAESRDVPLVRVFFCDAAAYDEGYMRPEDIAWRVRIKGRGGTVLQPAITQLEQAKDFPRKGPILVITDGYCDRLTIQREHAFLIPKGRYLPFTTRGKVFRFD